MNIQFFKNNGVLQLNSSAFPVVQNIPGIQHQVKMQDRQELTPYITEATTLENHQPDHLHKIGQRVDPRDQLGPVRHTVDGSVKTSKEDKHYHQKEGDQHRLLLVIGVS